MVVEVSPEQAKILLLCKDKGQLNMTYIDRDREQRPDRPQGLGKGDPGRDPERRSPDKPITPIVTELYSGNGRRLHTFKDGLRADRYGIERFDYNRNRGFGGGYGDFEAATSPRFRTRTRSSARGAETTCRSRQEPHRPPAMAVSAATPVTADLVATTDSAAMPDSVEPATEPPPPVRKAETEIG